MPDADSASNAGPFANGYVLNVAVERRPLLLDAARWNRLTAEVVPDFTHRRGFPLVCFLGFQDGAITHLALGRRGHRAATGLRRINLHDLARISALVPYDAVLHRIPTRFRPHVRKRFTKGGLLPQGSFVAVVDAIRELLPESNRILDRFSERRRTELARLGANTRRALAFQKETVATALTLAGIDPVALGDWRPRSEAGPVPSFLDGLPEARLREDQMIISDLQHFPGFDLVRSTQHAAAVFTNNRVTLTVVMANRHPLEQQLGADLIYRNDTYGSFVVVQYKAMDDESGTSRFRLPNEQLAAVLERMDTLWGLLRDCAPDPGLGGFRLKDDPFFLKMCPRVVFDPDEANLIQGMYIPLEYWRRLEQAPSIEGPFDGRAVTYGNVERYLTNTTFADLVAGGWIGTRKPQSEILDPVIRQILEASRTVTIAVKRDLTSAEQAEHLEHEEIEADEREDL